MRQHCVPRLGAHCFTLAPENDVSLPRVVTPSPLDWGRGGESVAKERAIVPAFNPLEIYGHTKNRRF